MDGFTRSARLSAGLMMGGMVLSGCGRSANGDASENGRDAGVDVLAGDGTTGSGAQALPGPDAADDAAEPGPAPKDFGCGPHTGPTLDPELFPVCDLCDAARCVPGELTGEAGALLADCEHGGKCVPEAFIEPMGQLRAASCRSVAGAEGRCVSRCVPAVVAQAPFLPRDVCGEDELCAPCFDPISGQETGACSLGCDSGPVEPPFVFDRCCGGIGACVDVDIVPEGYRGELGADSCDEGALCAPSAFAHPYGFIPDTCRSVSGGEGRCLPDCLPAVARIASFLPRDACPDRHLCAPCYDPLTGESTGACELSNDPGPAEPPLIFDACCEGAGTCVPRDLVPSGDAAHLGTDTCPFGSGLCVPDEILEEAVPRTCQSYRGAEGRCLSSCLPQVAALADMLTVDLCAETHLCVPCFHPLDGSPTGACSLGTDPGPQEGPDPFPGCCSGHGTCVPESLVPASQQGSLPRDSCTDEGFLCAPTRLIEDPGASFQSCSSGFPLFTRGACVPSCLLGTESFLFGRRSCRSGEKCVPCSVPLFGSTGACF